MAGGKEELPQGAQPAASETTRKRADEMRARAAEFWKELGLPAPAHLDETLAPEVNRELLRRLARDDLQPETAAIVRRLITAFESWDDAYTIILQEDYLQSLDDHD